VHDSDHEPPLPNGLQALTPAQESLAEFMMLDPDWLAAAAETSRLYRPTSTMTRASIHGCLNSLQLKCVMLCANCFVETLRKPNVVYALGF
jgi:hypothetical protein